MSGNAAGLGEVSQTINLSREAETMVRNAEGSKMTLDDAVAFSKSFHIGELLNNSLNIRRTQNESNKIQHSSANQDQVVSDFDSQ